MFTWNPNRGARTLAVFFAAIIFGGAAANASLLNPGATLSLRSAHEPEDGHLIAATNFTFTSASFTGTLTSKVWADDESNPWGGLTFSYRLANTSDCTESLGLFTLGGFAESLVDVNYSGSGVAPRQVSRSLSGAKITFGFFDRGGDETLRPGSVSAWLVIQTGCNTWGLNQLVGMDLQDVTAATFAPTVVPEPVASGLLLVGGIAVIAARRMKC